ncbi:tyrosinase family protein [Pseudomonas wadenswilerensis]
MTYVRKDLWKLGETWNPTLLWYAKAVQELQKRPITDPTSWRFLAAMHGFDEQLWIEDGYYTKGEKLPPATDRELFWNRCQHRTWFFLPWHRPYVLSFEQIVRAAVEKLGGPKDWALPYWDYDDFAERPETLKLPQEFYDKTLPDGTPNPLALRVDLRYGLSGDGIIKLDPVQLDFAQAANEVQYKGTSKANPGFGGQNPQQTAPNDLAFGYLESSPHNHVHNMVGGDNGKDDDAYHEGLMADPRTAGLDPIFWLHHANIDRLWQIWLNRDPSHQNPTESAFVDGPPKGSPFVYPEPNGDSRFWKVGETLDMAALGYTYESFHDPVPKAKPVLKQAAAFAAKPAVAAVKEPVVELIGANSSSIKLIGRKSASEVRLDKPGLAKVAKSLAAKGLVAEHVAAPTHERVFLNLENIRGRRNTVYLEVYVGVPAGEQPSAHPELCAGGISLFGVAAASEANDPHGGNGVNASLEITGIVDALRAKGDLDLAHLQIDLVPNKNLSADDELSVGRISLYRQGE